MISYKLFFFKQKSLKKEDIKSYNLRENFFSNLALIV